MSAPKKAPVKKAAPVKKVAAKKTAPAKKVAAKSEPVKKAAAKVEPAKKAAPAKKAPAPIIDDSGPEEAPAPVKRAPRITTVSILASGPGDPQLLSVRAAALLDRADIVLADIEALGIAQAYARPEVISTPIGKDGIALAPAERAKVAADAAKAGQHVVRLIAGDPIVDGTLVNEASALTKLGIAFEVVPAVSDVSGIPAYAGFSLTGGKVREVRVLDAQASDTPWADLMSPRATLVFVHGADKAPQIAEALMKAGRDPQTPIAVTRDGSTVDQRTIVSTLAEVGAVTKAQKAHGPGLVVIGEIIEQRDKLDWFERKALIGWRVLIPRTQDNAGPLIEMLRANGAVPVEVPTISVEPPRTPQQIDRAVHGLVSGRYEWIGFTSVNAVRAIREKLDEYGLDARSFAGLKVAAVGESTVDALIEFGVRPDLVPREDQNTQALLDIWPVYDSLVDPINRVFLPRADIATDTLVAGLGELGWEVEDITAYRTVRAAPPPAATREAIKSGGFDAVLFTSSATVRNLVGIAGKPHLSTVVACIGPQTAKTAQEHGLRVDVLAEVSTPEGLVQALAAHGNALRDSATDADGNWRPSKRRVVARRKAT